MTKISTFNPRVIWQKHDVRVVRTSLEHAKGLAVANSVVVEVCSVDAMGEVCWMPAGIDIEVRIIVTALLELDTTGHIIDRWLDKNTDLSEVERAAFRTTGWTRE